MFNIKFDKRIKNVILITSIVLLIFIGTGVALAYITSATDPLPNAFDPGEVSCSVNESFGGYVKSNVSIKNTGNVPAYIRAEAVITWSSDTSTGEILARAPKEGVNYAISYGDPLWIMGDDGFFYYTEPVEPGADTALLFESISKVGDFPEGYSLSVDIIATAIQAEPVSVVEDEWGVMTANGKITP